MTIETAQAGFLSHKNLSATGTYLVIGNGRMARHFVHYLKYKNLPFYNWARANSEPSQLLTWLESAHRVLLLISDQAIADFVDQYPVLKSKFLVHFSGALSFDFAAGAHPLSTFSDQLYSLGEYAKTPFLIDQPKLQLSDVLPGFQNPYYHIDKSKKALYHALCVMSGNFTTMLWQQTFRKFETDLNLPAHVLHTYLTQVTKNLIQKPASALTGPFVRNDIETIEKNLNSLHGQPEQELYKAFIQYFRSVNGSQAEIDSQSKSSTQKQTTHKYRNPEGQI
jgi:predicted short-subunit dehydrogenase-like oxidoreductase (DUF2520 family)